jgi:hypothetical protein
MSGPAVSRTQSGSIYDVEDEKAGYVTPKPSNPGAVKGDVRKNQMIEDMDQLESGKIKPGAKLIFVICLDAKWLFLKAQEIAS